MPDFYLERPIYLEIKPKFLDRQESELCAELAISTKHNVVAFYGNVEVQDGRPKADTYGKSVIKKTLEGPGSICFDHKTLTWQTSDDLLPELKKRLLEVKPDAVYQAFWMPDDKPLYWCECPCRNRITLSPYGKLSPATCGNGCRMQMFDKITQRLARRIVKSNLMKPMLILGMNSQQVQCGFTTLGRQDYCGRLTRHRNTSFGRKWRRSDSSHTRRNMERGLHRPEQSH